MSQAEPMHASFPHTSAFSSAELSAINEWNFHRGPAIYPEELLEGIKSGKVISETLLIEKPPPDNSAWYDASRYVVVLGGECDGIFYADMYVVQYRLKANCFQTSLAQIRRCTPYCRSRRCKLSILLEWRRCLPLLE